MGISSGMIKLNAAEVPEKKPDTDPQSLFVKYPSLYEHNPYLANEVKVEKTNERSLAVGKVFPVISNQKVNSYLKEISEVCNITKDVTFHLARHIFATTITLSNGVPIETVAKC